MTFHEKMRALMYDRRHTVIARQVGVHPITFASYVNHGRMPAADKAMKIARALGVDIAWLLDDGKNWPPVRVESSTPPETVAA